MAVLAKNQITIVHLTDGDSYEVRYIRTQTRPTQPAGDYPSGWSVSVPSSGYGNVWYIQGVRTASGALQGSWSIPALYDSYSSNLLENQKWTVGTGSCGNYGLNGVADDQIREIGTTPFGGQDIIWRAVDSDTASDGDGGWNHTTIPIDHTKMYRVSVWMLQKSDAGTLYLGCATDGSKTYNLSGIVNTNPYFWNGDLPSTNKWYLVVGYIYGSGHTGTSNHELGGVYDGKTGLKAVNTTTSYKNGVGATLQTHRAYQFYTTVPGTEVQFYEPRFDLCDGNEPSINDLLRTGTQGQQGIQGPAGTNGTSQYVHIRYSVNADGSSFTTTPQSNTAYVGLANTTSSTAPTANTGYTWSNFKGATGSQGIQGPAGTNGQTTYTWVKYADTDTGSGMTDTPSGKRYIGLAFNKTTATESTTASDYSWSPLYDNVVVGATNLWLSSSVEDSYSKWATGDATKSLATDVLWNGKSTIKVVKGSVSSGGIYNSTVRSGLPANAQFTYSFMVYSSVDMNIGGASLGHMQVVGTSNATNVHRETSVSYNPSSLSANTWTKVSITFKTPVEAAAGELFTFKSYLYYLTYGATYYFADFKLEKGNIATDWTPAPEDTQKQIDDGFDGVNTNLDEMNKNIIDTLGETLYNALQSYVNIDNWTALKQDVEATLDILKDQIVINFDKTNEIITAVDGDIQSKFEVLNKYITFTQDGIEIGAGESGLTLTMDNDMISFQKNGEQFGWWDGVDFHTGNIVVNVDERAQFGDFAFVPRSDGSLMFLKVGGNE